MRFIDVEGVRLAFRDEGKGRPVVLLHAFPLSSASFERQVAALHSKHRFIIPDHRGFGASAPGDASLEMSRIARDVVAILDALEIDSAVVAGVSMGGYAAMALLREDAGRVAGLVLAGTQSGADDEAARARREQSAHQVLGHGLDVIVETMLPRLIAAAPHSALGHEVERMIREATPQAVAAGQRGMAVRLDSREVLARYSGPALVLVGEADGITPVEKARELAGLIAGARLEVIPGAGHLVNQEAPAAFNAALDRFLQAL